MRIRPAAWGALLLALACQASPEGLVVTERDAARCLARAHPDAVSLLAASRPAVRRIASTRGRPDYVCQVDRDVHLVYTQLDEALPLAGPPAAIPAKLLALLPAREQGRIELRRVAAEGSSRPKPPRAPVPAALAPAPDRFDVDSLVAALSRPTSFGEAGVSGWQRAALPDGTLQAAARYHQKLYEVQADRVAVVVQLDPGRNHTIAGAALACRRLNDAVFGRNSMAANHAAMELLYAIGTGSGRRMLERKISGRRLTAQRLAGRDQVLFAIHSR